MWTVMLRFLFVLICLCAVTNAQRDVYHSSKRGNEIRLCGRNLSNKLNAECKGVYNTMFKKADKDSEPVFWMDEPAAPGDAAAATATDTATDTDAATDQLPYPLQSLPNQFLRSSRRRKRQGIYDECCLKWCTIAELRSYCAGP